MPKRPRGAAQAVTILHRGFRCLTCRAFEKIRMLQHRLTAAPRSCAAEPQRARFTTPIEKAIPPSRQQPARSIFIQNGSSAHNGKPTSRLGRPRSDGTGGDGGTSPPIAGRIRGGSITSRPHAGWRTAQPRRHVRARQPRDTSSRSRRSRECGGALQKSSGITHVNPGGRRSMNCPSVASDGTNVVPSHSHKLPSQERPNNDFQMGRALVGLSCGSGNGSGPS